MKKGLSILLALIMVLSIFTVIPFSVTAKEEDLADTKATPHSQNEAIAWIKARADEGWWKDVDGAYGCQCVDLVMAYYEYFGYSRMSGNGRDYKTGHLPSGSGWFYSSTPVAGSILVRDGDGGSFPYGHVGLVYAVSGSTMYTVETNLESPWSGSYPNAKAQYKTRNVNFAVTFIVPKFSNHTCKHDKTKDKWLYFWAEHPHHDTYACYECGAEWTDMSSSNYYNQCELCNPPTPGKPIITTFDLQNWSDGTFKLLNIVWTAASNAASYEIVFYDYDTGAVVKSLSFSSSTTSATLNYSDVPKGKYWVRVKSVNNSGANWSEAKQGEFVAPPTPTSAWVKASKSAVPVGEEITFTYGGIPEFNYNFYLTIKRDGNIVFDENVNLAHTTGKTLTFDTAGNYTALVKVQHNSGTAISPEIPFTVFDPVTLGSDFTANISNAVYSNTPRILSTDLESVTVSNSYTNTEEQKWHFEIQTDNSYKITNMDTGLVLDASDNKVRTLLDTDSDNQRFYPVYHYFGFALVSKTTGLAIDIKDGSAKLKEFDPSANNDGQPFSIDGYFDTEPSKTMTYNGHTYELYSVRMPWNQAERFCEYKGGHLVTITSAEEQEKVYGMCGNAGFAVWLGATDWGREGDWYWVTGEKFEYTNWHTDRPGSSTSINCAALYAYASNDWGQGIWNDWNNIQPINSTQMFLICEYDNGDVNASSYQPSKVIEQNGIKYEVYDKSVDWLTAEAICEAKGGRLALVNSAEDNNTVKNVADQGSLTEYWVDATDRNHEGTWTDHNGTELTYLNWADKSPQNDFNMGQFAVIKKGTGYIFDQKNVNAIRNQNVGFICEYSPEAKSIKLNKDEITIAKGETYQLQATVTPAKADQTVSWRSSETSVATVDQTGVVTAVEEGFAIIYAETTNGLSAPCVVNVQTSAIILGDIDGDDEVSAMDATVIQRKIADIPLPSYIEWNDTIADVNGDDEVDMLDVTLLLRWLAGMRVNYPIGKAIS